MPATTTPVSPYATSDPGFAAYPVDDLLAGEAKLIARIKLCYGTDRESFERDVRPLVHRYAAYVHLLPATADNYFSTPGGLFRLGLETGFFSLQGTDAHIFSGRMSISVRRQLEPRWRHATFIAGLCCELHRLMTHVVVTDAAGSSWPPYIQPLADWLAARGSTRYFLRWRPQAEEVRGLGLFALPHVVSPAVMTYLSEGNEIIVPHLLASIGGIPVYREHNILDELVRRSLALVIDRNLTASADRYGSPQYGSHFARYLVDAMRRLAASDSTWVPNREKSRLWFGQDGLFLIWPGAADDIHRLLEADQLAGIPKAPETMMELLLTAGVFEPAAASRAIWFIQPPGTRTTLEAVKLSNPDLLLTWIDPAPAALPQKLVFKPEQPSAPVAMQPSRLRPDPAEIGTQLSLIPEPEPIANGDAPPFPQDETPKPSSPEPVLASPSVAFSLQAPMRLSQTVRGALAAAVRSLNADQGPATVCTIAQGLFVPLEEFERRGVQPSHAMRALGETNMLVKPEHDGPPTLAREFNGKPTVGIVLAPRHVNGLDLAAFSTPRGTER